MYIFRWCYYAFQQVFSVHRYDEEWDKILTSMMSNCRARIDGRFAIKFETNLGDRHVWIANWPYSSANPYRPVCANVRPKISTMIKLKDLCDEIRYRDMIEAHNGVDVDQTDRQE